jgi:transcriptional regulator with XRE-family HTH domain
VLLLRIPGPVPDRGDLPPSLPAALRARRRQLGITQKHLSDRLAAAETPVPVQALSQWENGHRRPSVDEVYALERALGLPDYTLLLRLRGESPEARDLYSRFSPESLYYVTTVVTEHVHVDHRGAVDRIDVTRRIRALRPVRTCFVPHAEDTRTHRVRIEGRSGCTTGIRRPLMKDRVEVRLELDRPLPAGHERVLRYTVRHRHYGELVTQDRQHRHNGSRMHTLIALTVSFATPGARIEWRTWRDRATPPDIRKVDLRRRTSDGEQWRYPGEIGCGVSWEVRP